MPKLSLTDLVDIVSTAGTPKLTRVKRLKYRPPYHPAFDFYKPFREHIIRNHRAGQGRAELPQVLSVVTDEKKLSNYPQLVTGYRKWWGRKKIEWFEPPSDIWSIGDVGVRVNPELGLSINGQPHLVKLYMKADGLARNRIHVITHLMHETLQDQCDPDTQMAVLDVRRSKLIKPTVPVTSLSALLQGELAYIASIWSLV